MIQANEFRRYNLISLSEDVFETISNGRNLENLWRVDKISDKDISIYNEIDGIEGIYGTFDLEHVNPIKITEEILLKFGFEERYKGMFGSFVSKFFGSLEFQFGKDCTMRIIKDQCGIIFNFNNMAVHQFQNLYFALTGEELEIKL